MIREEYTQALLLAVVAALALAFIPGINLLGYPFRLLITFVHELGHGLAAILTGGRFGRFVVFTNGEGVAYTAGGWRLLIIPAGYLSSALFGAGMIALGRNAEWSKNALMIIGGILVLLTLRYALPNIVSEHWFQGIITVIAGIGIGIGFIYVARYTNSMIILFLTNLLGIQAGLTAFNDLLALIRLTSSTQGSNDARSMAAITFIPAIVWAFIWAISAASIIGFSIWRTWLR
jgi:hypothetical protein